MGISFPALTDLPLNDNQIVRTLTLVQAILTLNMDSEGQMARRATWRIPLRMEVKLNIGGKVCSGTVTNLSERGMYINTDEKGFIEKAHCTISIPLNDEVLSVSGTLIRLSVNNGASEGVGVEFVNPPQKYLDFVENLLYVL